MAVEGAALLLDGDRLRACDRSRYAVCWAPGFANLRHLATDQTDRDAMPVQPRLPTA
jgi:hypothetical protein